MTNKREEPSMYEETAEGIALSLIPSTEKYMSFYYGNGDEQDEQEEEKKEEEIEA